MMVLQSAVVIYPVLIKFPGLIGNNINKLFRTLSTSNLQQSLKMNWKDEKVNYLSMSLDDKRKVYATRKFIDLSQIKTWTQYNKDNQLNPAIPLKKEYSIDVTMNAALADKVSLFAGDITALEVDAIVNAANKSLLGGGGVDGAIHKSAGADLLHSECKTFNGCQTGNCVITGGYKLPSKYVIHAVGPIGEKPDLLRSCYDNAIKIMLKDNLRTIAFPCISTGVYGYPNESAAHVAAMEVRKQLEANSNNIDRVIFCVFLQKDVKIYEGILQSYFPVS